MKHNKYRNTGIIFELLVRNITADTLAGKDSPAVNILKEYFSHGELAKEYKLYKSLISSQVLSESKANMMLETTTEIYKKLNKTSLKKQRYNLIKEIKKYYDIDDFFKAKISHYKEYAAVYSLFELYGSNEFTSPDSVVRNKIVILEHLTKRPTDDNVKSQLMKEYIDSDKGTRFLTYKILVEKFNNKYSIFNTPQKEILREYINNVSNTVHLKEFINLKFVDIKKDLKTLVRTVNDKITIIKLAEVINLIKPIEKNENVKDEDVLNLLQYTQLVEELKRTK